MIPIQLPQNLTSELQGVQVIDVSDSLPVNPKYTWPERGGVRNIHDLTTIIFHHDAWPKTKSAKFTDQQLLRVIANDHIKSVKNIPGGDPGFPYHAWIRNGIIYLCNPPEWRLYGAKDNNHNTVHICLSGDYVNYDAMTDADKKAMYVAFFMFKSVLPAYQFLKGHKEVSATSCPGYDMLQVRKDIAVIQEEMNYVAAPQKKEEIAYRIAGQVDYLYKMVRGKMGDGSPASEGNRKWALNQLLKLEGTMRKEGMLK